MKESLNRRRPATDAERAVLQAVRLINSNGFAIVVDERKMRVGVRFADGSAAWLNTDWQRN